MLPLTYLRILDREYVNCAVIPGNLAGGVQTGLMLILPLTALSWASPPHSQSLSSLPLLGSIHTIPACIHRTMLSFKYRQERARGFAESKAPHPQQPFSLTHALELFLNDILCPVVGEKSSPRLKLNME
jgi:hypothetical protein